MKDDMDYPPLSAEDQADVDREWEAYWCALLAPNGALDVERVKREMYAFSMLADDVSKVYMAVTGDKVSKPGTDPDVVIGLAKEHSGALAQDACEAALAAWRKETVELISRMRAGLDTTAYEEHDAATAWLRRMGR